MIEVIEDFLLKRINSPEDVGVLEGAPQFRFHAPPSRNNGRDRRRDRTTNETKRRSGPGGALKREPTEEEENAEVNNEQAPKDKEEGAGKESPEIKQKKKTFRFRGQEHELAKLLEINFTCNNIKVPKTKTLYEILQKNKQQQSLHVIPQFIDLH